ncbi:hypothetical protein CGCS363_v005459 [Colletotrichum siamense]|uniref:uncharacterized protein n=1 Tax=Colletotrichum siamense TaxID=690259 RepID=UPI00187327FC|nr:uncharacterized protein CGCS363_v005459 [Colletotrichum siamense]KAF5505372.1 hypothetical protein CGCS363_v005459 [Colletotrichum siamense]
MKPCDWRKADVIGAPLLVSGGNLAENLLKENHSPQLPQFMLRLLGPATASTATSSRRVVLALTLTGHWNILKTRCALKPSSRDTPEMRPASSVWCEFSPSRTYNAIRNISQEMSPAVPVDETDRRIPPYGASNPVGVMIVVDAKKSPWELGGLYEMRIKSSMTLWHH